MAFEENELLFGADKTERIVAIEMGDTGTVRVYRREKDGSTVVDVEPFHPFANGGEQVGQAGIAMRDHEVLAIGTASQNLPEEVGRRAEDGTVVLQHHVVFLDAEQIGDPVGLNRQDGDAVVGGRRRALLELGQWECGVTKSHQPREADWRGPRP